VRRSPELAEGRLDAALSFPAPDRTLTARTALSQTNGGVGYAAEGLARFTALCCAGRVQSVFICGFNDFVFLRFTLRRKC
jgi:hypothetical protein